MGLTVVKLNPAKPKARKTIKKRVRKKVAKKSTAPLKGAARRFIIELETFDSSKTRYRFYYWNGTTWISRRSPAMTTYVKAVALTKLQAIHLDFKPGKTLGKPLHIRVLPA